MKDIYDENEKKLLKLAHYLKTGVPDERFVLDYADQAEQGFPDKPGTKAGVCMWAAMIFDDLEIAVDSDKDPYLRYVDPTGRVHVKWDAVVHFFNLPYGKYFFEFIDHADKLFVRFPDKDNLGPKYMADRLEFYVHVGQGVRNFFWGE